MGGPGSTFTETANDAGDATGSPRAIFSTTREVGDRIRAEGGFGRRNQKNMTHFEAISFFVERCKWRSRREKGGGVESCAKIACMGLVRRHCPPPQLCSLNEPAVREVHESAIGKKIPEKALDR